MQTIFQTPGASDTPRMIAGQWATASKGLERNLKTVVDYFHSRNIPIKGGHLLVRLITSVVVNYTDDIDRFYTIVDARARAMANSFSLTSDSSKGSRHDGEFYGAGMTEFVIAANEPFEPSDAELNWKLQTPVRILAHPKTDLECHVPNGMAYSSEVGVAVIAVNIPLLLVMHRGFVHEQIKALQKGQQAKTTAHFVMSYVLPNAVQSHLNIALFNRCLQRLTGKPVANRTGRKHPFELENVAPQVDNALGSVFNYISKTEMTIKDILLCIPAVGGQSAMHALTVPNIAPVLQYAWIEMVMRLKNVAALMLLSKTQLRAYNKDALQHIKRRLQNDGMIPVVMSMLPTQEAKLYEEIIDAVILSASAS